MEFFQANNMCRTCVNTEENMMKIKNAFINCDNNTIHILDVLSFISEIELPQNYPDSICNTCIEKAAVVYKFKLQCEQANKILKDTIAEQIEGVVAPLEFKDNDVAEFKELKLEFETEELELKEPKLEYKTTEKPEHEDEDIHKSILHDILSGQRIKSEKHKKLKDKCKTNNSKDEEMHTLHFCFQCNKLFKSKCSLTAHIKRHQNKGNFLCTICGKGFNAQYNLDQHNTIHYERNYKCQMCHKKFPTSTRLMLHSRSHNGIKPYLCTICGKSFTQRSGLTNHSRRHQSTWERPYMCDICGKSFMDRSKMDQHSKIHTGERPFRCKQCEWGFIKKVDLQRHEAVHSGLKPHVCNVCGKAFAQKMHLNYHVMVHTKERPHVCTICGKGFIRRYYLKSHIKERHDMAENCDLE